jgi:hypothetical protein
MTAKKKAKELVRKYSCYLHGIDENVNFDVVIHDEAKSLALIAVDEVQRLIKDLSSCNYRFIYIIDEMNFWEEVKQEIEKL